MFTDRNGLVTWIMDGLGGEGDRKLAEQMFDAMRFDGRITYDDLHGLQVRDGVDLIAVAVEIEQSNHRELLRAAIDRSGLSDRKFATTIMVRDERTIRRWLAGDRAIPVAVMEWVERFMSAVES